MPELQFEEAYARLRSTMPDAEFLEVKKHGDVDKYGLPTGKKVATVVCFEPKLTNALRPIGDWIFLIDNRFIVNAVQKIAMVWLMHRGGLRYGELELMRALRHCFKRFYAESLVALATPPIGRALLIESVAFERRFIEALAQHSADANTEDSNSFNSDSLELARQAFFICQRHEMAHYLLRMPGECILENSAKLLDGALEPAIRNLIDSGQASLAEEAYCDALALDSIVHTESYYSELGPIGGMIYLEQVTAAFFCYTIVIELSKVWFLALQDARNGWDAAEETMSRPERPRLPLEAQATERSNLVSNLVRQYVAARNGDIRDTHRRFFFNFSSHNLIAGASANLESLSEVDEIASATNADREIARYLTLATLWTTGTSHYLINLVQQREWLGWARYDEPVEATQPLTTDESLRSSLKVAKALSAETFWEAMRGLYGEFAKVFDAIVEDLLYKSKPEDGTLARLQAFVEDLVMRIDAFGKDNETFSSADWGPYCEGVRTEHKRKVFESRLILLSLMRRSLSPDNGAAFEIPVKLRLSCLEEYAKRNRGANVAAFASILIPEWETDCLPTSLAN